MRRAEKHHRLSFLPDIAIEIEIEIDIDDEILFALSLLLSLVRCLVIRHLVVQIESRTHLFHYRREVLYVVT